MSDNKKRVPGFATRSIRTAEGTDFFMDNSTAVVSPLHLSTTYVWDKVTDPSFFQYSRSDNPTRFALECRYAALENTKYGLAFSSGMGAVTVLLFTLLNRGDHVLAFDDLYGGTKRLIGQFAEKLELGVDYVDFTDLARVKAAFKPNTQLLWIETPSNPLLKVCDIAAIAQLAHNVGALVVVDNTFMSPYFQNPVSLGADFVMHSATKYMSGHSDVVGGAVMLNNDEWYEKLKLNQNSMGVVPSPFDSYLILRGLKTLALRMAKHQSNALAIAHYLQAHPMVEQVYYPGLDTHPQYALSQKQSSGYSGMVSFEIKGGEPAAIAFLERLKLFILAESLGGVESLIEHPTRMTHASMTPEERKLAGISDALIRISVGNEEADDLIADLEQAFEHF